MQAVWAILLLTLPGVHCYDYNVGGLAAAVAAGVLLLIPIIAMAMVIAQWRDWYMKRQALKGRYRVPRKYWTMFKSKSTPTLASTPRSERKQEFIRMYDIQGNPESRSNTIHTPRTEVVHPPRTEVVYPPRTEVVYPPRTEVVYPPRTEMVHQSNGVAHFSRKPASAAYEEKVKTMVIEPEEEPVIMADILPDDHIQRPEQVTHHVALEQTMLGQTRQKEPYYTQPEPEVIHIGQGESGGVLRTTQQPEAYTVNTKYVGSSMEPDDMRTTVVRLDQRESEHLLGASGKQETYYVKSQLSGTRNDGNDIFITPMVPAAGGTEQNDDVTVIRASTRQTTDGSNVAVMTFPDSDEEAGNIPVAHTSDVLF